ncbi:MAG: glycosyl hydrolase 115 family protein, partial [Muribaculaceae bacterium]|nr:glycosyl hydrolase 115 family protein [Muribaculaceae bacterium]
MDTHKMQVLNVYNCQVQIMCNNGIDVSEDKEPESVSLKGCPIIYDPGDYTVVEKAAQMLADDLEKVTGIPSKVTAETLLPECDAIVVGTAGKSHIIEHLALGGYITIDSIKDQWERFIIKTVLLRGDGKSERGGKDCHLLVIAGSDRRGTAYGMTTLSRALGVDPWVWWGDVPVKQTPDAAVSADYLSTPPSVKYRGIFINDEDWGLLPWSAKNFEKELGDIGPKTYEKVCELLLRLKGNMFAPAMHSCTGAFYSHPESKIIADEYGIIVTTSHCEPMMFNNAALSEWDPKRDGDWDYGTNRDVIYNKFVNRLEEAAPYENIYTIGMRGVHDEAMSRERPVEERVALLEKVIADQRELLSRRLGKPAEEIPQIFVPYKETLDLYRKGLKLPGDVTIIWPDDNYGYMKSVSSPSERLRSGGSGVYYHTSYLGTPHDYLWVCTTPPAMMYRELKKAYSCGADRYWLLNVGDIKPAELDTQTFFDMAWDFTAFNYDNINSYQSSLLAEWCGEQYKDDFQQILDEYYRLAWIRKPEYMGWEIEWDTPDTREVGPTEFSFTNYKDAVKRIEDYSELAGKVDNLMQTLPDSLRTPFFEMLGYPVLASEMMNRKFLFAQLNGELAAEGDKAGANYAARLSTEAADSIESLTHIYNTLTDGKWNGMMTVPPGFCAKYQERPPLQLFPEIEERRVDLNTHPDTAPLCRTLDLRTAIIGPKAKKMGARLIDGIGYDGYILQLSDPVISEIIAPLLDSIIAPGSGTDIPNKADDSVVSKIDSPVATVALGSYKGVEAVSEVLLPIEELTGDSVTLQIFHLPFFPMYEGKGCKIGVSLDGGDEQIIEYLPEEWSKPWKLNVLRNSALSTVTFPLTPNTNLLPNSD